MSKQEHEITAGMPINMLIKFVITVAVTFKLSSGAKWVSVALNETYITKRRKRRRWKSNEESRAEREIISLAVAGKLLRTGAVHIQDLLPYMKSAYRS